MTAQINIKIEEELKANVDKIFKKLGISATDAVRIFFKKVESERGLPFDMKIDYEPNEETKQALLFGEFEKVNNINDIWK